MRELLDSNPNDIDVKWIGQLLKWGVALVSTVSPCSREDKKEMSAKSALSVPRAAAMKEREYCEAIKRKWLASVHDITDGADFAAYWWLLFMHKLREHI